MRKRSCKSHSLYGILLNIAYDSNTISNQSSQIEIRRAIQSNEDFAGPRCRYREFDNLRLGRSGFSVHNSTVEIAFAAHRSRHQKAISIYRHVFKFSAKIARDACRYISLFERKGKRSGSASNLSDCCLEPPHKLTHVHEVYFWPKKQRSSIPVPLTLSPHRRLVPSFQSRMAQPMRRRQTKCRCTGTRRFLGCRRRDGGSNLTQTESVCMTNLAGYHLKRAG